MKIPRLIGENKSQQSSIHRAVWLKYVHVGTVTDTVTKCFDVTVKLCLGIRFRTDGYIHRITVAE